MRDFFASGKSKQVPLKLSQPSASVDRTAAKALYEAVDNNGFRCRRPTDERACSRRRADEIPLQPQPQPHSDPFMQITRCIASEGESERARLDEDPSPVDYRTGCMDRQTATMETLSTRPRPAAAALSPLLTAPARLWLAAPSLVILGLLVMPGGEFNVWEFTF